VKTDSKQENKHFVKSIHSQRRYSHFTIIFPSLLQKVLVPSMP